jgi:transposase
MIPPQYVTPFVKRGKNDRNDAEAISEAASRPSMRFVAVKSAERQAAAMVLSVRELLVKQRTQAINALRGHAAEFGVVAARGTSRVVELLAKLAQDGSVPPAGLRMLSLLGEEVTHLDGRIAALDGELREAAKRCETAKRLAQVPGIGVIGALTLSLTIDAGQFRSGRHFASSLGLVPKQRSTAGRQRLGGISREGNERLRQVLVVGSMAVVRLAKPGRSRLVDWLLKLLERCRSRKLAAVALANKLARIAWAMMARGQAYRSGAPVAA